LILSYSSDCKLHSLIGIGEERFKRCEFYLGKIGIQKKITWPIETMLKLASLKQLGLSG
jgi:hypothetical protein